MKGVLSARLKGSDGAETPLSGFSDVGALSDGVSGQRLADAFGLVFLAELLVRVIAAPEASPRADPPVNVTAAAPEASPRADPPVNVTAASEASPRAAAPVEAEPLTFPSVTVS